MDPVLNPHLTGAGGQGLCNVQHIPHWFLCREGKTSPLGEAWGNPADFEVPPETPSPLLAQSSKDEPASGRVSLRAFSSTFPAVTCPSSSCFHLGSYWFCHRIKTTKGEESPSKYIKVKTSALESFGRVRQKTLRGWWELCFTPGNLKLRAEIPTVVIYVRPWPHPTHRARGGKEYEPDPSTES